MGRAAKLRPEKGLERKDLEGQLNSLGFVWEDKGCHDGAQSTGKMCLMKIPWWSVWMMAVKRGKRQEATTTVQRRDDGPGLGVAHLWKGRGRRQLRDKSKRQNQELLLMVLMWVRGGEEAKMRLGFLGFLLWVAGRAALKKGGLGKGKAGEGGGEPAWGHVSCVVFAGYIVSAAPPVGSMLYILQRVVNPTLWLNYNQEGSNPGTFQQFCEVSTIFLKEKIPGLKGGDD